jgi:hypothetical protein
MWFEPAKKAVPFSGDPAFPQCERGFRLAPMPDARTLSASEFEAALRTLGAGAASGDGNLGCLACEGCERCRECTFCSDSSGLSRCHYTTGCTDCVDCAHCDDCRGCSACQHCTGSEDCIGSAYLVRSVGCMGCTYCFGCVGLQRRDFHILNEAYDRATYFEVTARLSRELARSPHEPAPRRTP